MQSETGFPSSNQLKSYVASKSRLKLAARADCQRMLAFLCQVIILRPHPHYTRNVRKKNSENHPRFTHLKIRRSADPHFTGGARNNA